MQFCKLHTFQKYKIGVLAIHNNDFWDNCCHWCGAADAWPIAGGQSIYTGMEQAEFWNTMQGNLICGEQSLRPRLKDVPVYMPLPPAPDSTSLFKVQQSGGAIDAFQ